MHLRVTGMDSLLPQDCHVSLKNLQFVPHAAAHATELAPSSGWQVGSSLTIPKRLRTYAIFSS
jgi:hypothetical protein